MANPKAQGEVDIVLDANGAPVMAAIDRAFKRIKDIERVVGNIQKESGKAADAFNKIGLGNFDKMLRNLEGIEKRLQAAARQPITRQGGDINFSGQIRKVGEFQKGLNAATNAAQAFQGRLNDIDRKLISMGNAGKVDKGWLSKRLGVEAAQRDFQKLQREIEATDKMARRGGVSADRSKLASAEASLFGALKGRKANLAPYIMQLQLAADEYINEVRKQRRRITTEANAGSGSGAPPIFGATGWKGVLARTAAYGGAASLIFGAVSAMKTGVTEAIKFDDQLHKVAGIAGLTETQMGRLGETIMEVSENTRFARQEIAEASTVLAQAGFSAADIKNSLGAIAQLAASSGSSFAEVTDVMTSAIGAFQLNANEATTIANNLAAALNMTKLNIQQVALGIQYAGATAYENNLTFQDLTASFAALAQAGIRSGSTMGTGIRQLLTDFLTPSKKMVAELDKLGLTMDDINVKTHGLDGVIKRLTESGFGAAEAYQGLEVRAAAAFLALRNQQDIALKVATAQANMKAAVDGNAKSMDSLAAQWQEFKNQLNNSVTQGLNPLVAGLKNLLKASNDVTASRKEYAEMEARFTKEFAGQADSVEKVRQAMEAYKADKDYLIQSEENHRQKMEAVNTAVNESAEALDHEQQVLDQVDRALLRVSTKKELLSKDSAALAAETLNLQGQFAGLSQQLQGTALSYDNLTAALMRYRQMQLSQVGLRAMQAAAAADKQVGTTATDAKYALHAIKSGGLYNRLPKDVQAMIDKAQKGVGYDRSSALIGIQDYIGGYRGKGLNPNEKRMLQQFTSRTGELGMAMTRREDATNVMNVAKLLGGDVGSKLAMDIQNISTPAQGRKVMADIANRMKGKSGPALTALTELMNNAAAKTSMIAPPQKPESKAKTGGGSNRAEQQQDRRNLDIARQRQKADQMGLANAIKDIAKFPRGSVGGDDDIVISAGETSLTPGRVKKNIEKVSESLEKWVAGRYDLMRAQIDRDDMGGSDAATFKAEVEREIAEKREETAQAVAEGLAKALDAMIKAAEDTAAKAAAAADHALNMSAARLKSLDRVSGRGGSVPDYVRGYYERKQSEAQDTRDRSQVGINEKEIEDLTKALSFWENQQGALMDQFPGLNAELSPFTDKIRDLKQQIGDLTNANAELKASFEDYIPDDLSTNLDMMIEQFKQQRGLTSTLNQDLTNLASGGLNAAYDAMNTFFTDILTGSKSVGAAFKDMVQGMIKALQQLIAEFITKQIFKLLLSAIGGAGGGGGDLGGWSVIGGTYHGGLNTKGAYRGEHIKDGVVGRDSTIRRVAKGEFIMRRAAVNSIGVDTMHKLNDQGAAAIKPNVMAAAPPVNQEVAVYVVKEGEKPQMRKQDVLVAVHDDILKNGETKKLIRLVAQGA